jgi:hypothetical protein
MVESRQGLAQAEACDYKELRYHRLANATTVYFPARFKTAEVIVRTPVLMLGSGTG